MWWSLKNFYTPGEDLATSAMLSVDYWRKYSHFQKQHPKTYTSALPTNLDLQVTADSMRSSRKERRWCAHLLFIADWHTITRFGCWGPSATIWWCRNTKYSPRCHLTHCRSYRWSATCQAVVKRNHFPSLIRYTLYKEHDICCQSLWHSKWIFRNFVFPLIQALCDGHVLYLYLIVLKRMKALLALCMLINNPHSHPLMHSLQIVWPHYRAHSHCGTPVLDWTFFSSFIIIICHCCLTGAVA